MSLISEALRKARRETAGRGGEQRGVEAPSGWDRPSSRAPLGAGLVLGAVIALAAALAGAAAVWWALGRGGDDVTAHLDAEAEAEATEPVASPTTIDGAPGVPLSGESASDSRLEPDVAFRDEPSAGIEPGRRSQPVAEHRPATESADVEIGESGAGDAAGPIPGPSGSPGDGDPADLESGTRVFVVEADLGRVTLTLDFIAYRPDDPFAEINGLEVHVGSRIEGLVVEEIARDHVRLSGDDGEVILRVR